MPPKAASPLLFATLVLAACSTVPSLAPTAAPASPTIRTPTASSAPATTPLPTPFVTAEGWRPVPEQAALLGLHLQQVVWTGTRFVAAGMDAAGRGVFVDSSDGLRWHLQPAVGEEASVAVLAAGPGGLVAIGSLGDSTTSWSSPDGLAWTPQRGAFPTALGDDDIVKVTGAVAIPGGWLAVGRDEPGSGTQIDLRALRALVWTSRDGRSWTPVPAQPALEPGGMNAVATFDGVFTAVGNRGEDAAIWTSGDGLHWLAGADEPVFRPPPGSSEPFVTAYGVATVRGASVVVGIALGVGDGGAPASRAWWSSGDGRWEEAAIDRPDVAGFEAVSPVGAGFLATGPTWAGMSTCPGGIWAAVDGSAWRCEGADPAFTGFMARAVAASGTVELVVGGTANEWAVPGRSGAAWWRPAKG